MDECFDSASNDVRENSPSAPRCVNDSLVCLNFKVPLLVRQKFKIHAARNHMSMTEMLLQLLNRSLTADASGTASKMLTKRSEHEIEE